MVQAQNECRWVTAKHHICEPKFFVVETTDDDEYVSLLQSYQIRQARGAFVLFF